MFEALGVTVTVGVTRLTDTELVPAALAYVAEPAVSGV
jgi:hypothetical protein